MLLSALKVEKSAVLRSAVCVVGGGVAGITLASEFERRGIDCILLESGGLSADEATRDLYRGENVGLPYVFADGCRGRFLGGSSNYWGGWCRPLDEHDMARRDWVPESGWPFDRSELTPYYERAHKVLQLGPFSYDVESWVSAINRSDVRRIVLPTGRVMDVLTQFSSPACLSVVYHDLLRRSKYVRTYLHANVVDIETDPSAQAVRRVRVKTLSGRSFSVEATHFVLACGGIENARLLLSSNNAQPSGLGNGNDLVGRYFADHPRLTLGNVRFKPEWRKNRLYDIKFHYLSRAVSAHNKYVSAQFSINREVQKREGLLNSLMWFSSVFPGEGTDTAGALIRMKHRLHGKAGPGSSVWRDLSLLYRHPIVTGSFVAARLWKPQTLINTVQIEVVCEPAPNRDSRVTLAGERDQLGMRRVRVDWRLGEQVKRSFDRSVAIFAEELRSAGVAEVDLVRPLEGREWPVVNPTPWYHMGTWHHMGTTRMHDSPKYGVVDRHSKIHGMANLYVTGSSVFPTFGANYPTITITALSLRLADHLFERLKMQESPVTVKSDHIGLIQKRTC